MGAVPRTVKPLEGEGFAALYAKHADPLAVWLARRTLDPETAIDLAAETFAQAYLSRRRFRGGTEASAAAWLYAIARHQLSRYHRKGKAERRALGRLGVDVPAAEPEDLERLERDADLASLRTKLDGALQEISDEQRAAVSLRIVEELSYPDVAARLGTTCLLYTSPSPRD